MAGKNQPRRDTPGREQQVTLLFHPPLARLWGERITPEPLTICWGPDGFTNPVCLADASQGGSINLEMRSPQAMTYQMKGSFPDSLANRRSTFLPGNLRKRGERMGAVYQTVQFDLEGDPARATRIAPEAMLCLHETESGWTQSPERLTDPLK